LGQRSDVSRKWSTSLQGNENEAVARMNIDNYFSKFATKRPNGAFCHILADTVIPLPITFD